MPTSKRYAELIKDPAYKERQKQKRKKNPQPSPKTRTLLRGRRYIDVYNEFLEKQGGRCAICGRRPEDIRSGKNRLDIDHKHGTTRIRGLLCRRCNYQLGFVEKYMQEIIVYLRGK